MERKSSNPNRGSKKVSNHAGGELFPLGAKSNREETKSKITFKPTTERKRESSQPLISVSKKPKVSVRHGLDPAANSSEIWEQIAVESDIEDLLESIFNYNDPQDSDSLLRIFCGCMRQLNSINNRPKTDVIYFSLLYLAKVQPEFFTNDTVVSALLYFLRRDNNLKMRHQVQNQILATNLLARGFYDKKKWPEIFLKTYLEDAVNERFWSDIDFCAPYILNICSSFNTKKPPHNILTTDTTASVNVHNRDGTVIIDDDSGDNSCHGNEVAAHYNIHENCKELFASSNRFEENDRLVEKYVTELIKEQFNKRQQQEHSTRNLIKFLCATCGLPEVRLLCVSRLELWIHNAKLVKHAQQLLAYISFNVTVKDTDVLAVLVKMRLKAKPLINHFMHCIRETIITQPDILTTLLKLVVQNELSNTRNPNNMIILATMFQAAPEVSAKHLAEIYQEFLLQREDCIRTLRVFLRELVRILRYELNIVEFCKAFLRERIEISKSIENSEFRERIFQSMVDIICICMLLSVSPQVREAHLSLKTNRDVKSSTVLMRFYHQMSQLQLDAVSWMFDTVPTLFKLKNSEYHQALYKILLLESPDHYSKCDQWPSEPERASLLRMISETPVHEETLLRIILIGITKEIQFSITDTFDIIMQVLKRASAMRHFNVAAIEANKFDIIDFLFSMSEYHHPENIKLPDDYEPPKLAIVILYWKAWLILLMISAHNPSSFGAFCWEHYPTMKMLMEMCITNQFNENIMPKEELQILSMERESILEFETYLAAQTSQTIITEENAILIAQLMLMNPMGPPRKPSQAVLDQLKCLNKTYKLGHLLCRSRKPDLLLDIIQRYGTTQSMPWLSDLVQNSEGEFNHLPVQCLCEFLLFNSNLINEENSRDAELIEFLRNLIISPETNKQIVCEVLDYIFRRLSSTSKQSRISALLGLKIIFKSTEIEDNEWLLVSIPQIPHFMDVRCFIVPQLRAACQVENSPELVMTYIQFIAAHTLNDPVNDMLDHVIDMAQLIVERSTMFQHIIPSPEYMSNEVKTNSFIEQSRVQTLKCLFVMFNNYIIKLREYQAPYEWTEYPDLLMVQFHDGMELPLHLNIIHAFIILLTHSSNSMPESIPILDYWFAIGRTQPTAYLPSLPHESVQLLPDWLKLKMIRSPVERLIDAAIQELTPDQIVLFVQNFGTPVNSMSKLLAMLDHAVIEQFDAVKNAILNKAYLAQLIEIQQSRGAKNGHLTVQALELFSESLTFPDPSCLKTASMVPMNFKQLFVERSFVTFSEKTNIIPQILNCERLLTRSEKTSFHKNIYHLIKHIKLESCIENFKYAALENDVLINILESLFNFERYKFIFKEEENANLCTTFKVIVSKNDCQQRNRIKEFLEKFYEIIGMDTSNNRFANLVSIIHKFVKGSMVKIRDKSLDISEPFLLNDMVHEFERTDCSANNRSSTLKPSRLLSTMELSRNGRLVDWMTEFNPDVIDTIKTTQTKFLFSKSCSSFRFYLLSLMCHQSSWKTIISALEYLLLNPAKCSDSTIILNFMDALTNNPKLWQGRDKLTPKVVHQEVILNIKENEIPGFCAFLMEEGCQDPDNFNLSNNNLCSRINLFFNISQKNDKMVVKLLENVICSSFSEKLKSRIIHQVYLMFPSIKFSRFQNQINSRAKLQNLKGCQSDRVSNYLITCLGSLFLKKDFEALSSDIELLIRKLASSHPELFLRQLGVMSSLIEGRSQITTRLLRDEFHVHRFVQILRTLELLQPMVFEEEYKEEFQSALRCYFSFFQNHTSVKESYQILVKFVEILQGYVNVNPSNAFSFIEQFSNVMLELSSRYSNVSSLQSLIQAVAFFQHKTTYSAIEDSINDFKQDSELDEHAEQKNTNPVILDAEEQYSASPNLGFDANSKGSHQLTSLNQNATSNKSYMSPHFAALIKIVKHSNSEDVILAPIQEIECLTSKRFSFLNDLFERLLELIFSPSAQVRSNAYILLIRHLKHNPGRTDVNRCAFTAYVQCLRDENSCVAATAIDNLSEMTLLLQEYAVEILSVAFSLGIRSRLNTATQIKRVLQTLLLQHGY